MKELEIHNIHPYHGKFYYGIPQYFIETYGKDVETILDPFCGSGTTLVEASVYGKKSIGVDINFLSCKISQAKISIIEKNKFSNYLKNILIENTPFELNFKDSDIWFTLGNYQEMCLIYNGIQKIQDPIYQNIFEVILSSVLKTTCNKRKVWNNGYIADNVKPNLESKISLRKTFENKSKKFLKASLEYSKVKKGENSVIPCNILDFKSKSKFDMVITSPPYPFAVDFAKYNRLSYYLFNQDLELAVENEAGARSKRNKKNCVEDFFSEMQKLYLHIMSLVKTGGYACMTVGNTHRNNKKIDFVEWLISLFLQNNWELIENTERKLTKQSMPQKRIPIEHVLVFKRN